MNMPLELLTIKLRLKSTTLVADLIKVLDNVSLELESVQGVFIVPLHQLPVAGGIDGWDRENNKGVSTDD